MRLVMSALSLGLLSTIQRRGVTPLVTLKNFSGATRWKSRSTVCLSSSRVERRDAVDRVAADAGQVRHAHVALAALVDQRQALDQRLVARDGAAARRRGSGG